LRPLLFRRTIWKAISPNPYPPPFSLSSPRIEYCASEAFFPLSRTYPVRRASPGKEKGPPSPLFFPPPPVCSHREARTPPRFSSFSFARLLFVVDEEEQIPSFFSPPSPSLTDEACDHFRSLSSRCTRSARQKASSFFPFVCFFLGSGPLPSPLPLSRRLCPKSIKIFLVAFFSFPFWGRNRSRKKNEFFLFFLPFFFPFRCAAP